MAFAIISDLHSNLEAVTQVFADIERRGIRDIYCLGDVVGYGPNPLEVTDVVMERCKVTLKGNHDEALIHGAYAFHLRARKAIDWTRETLRPHFFSGTAVRRRWDFLKELPARHEQGAHLFIHGSPRDPTNEYVLSTELGLGPSDKFEEIFAHTERMLFVGHTHLPCVITDEYECRTAAELGNRWTYTGRGKAVVNVGSVGQPRDRDPRACYATVDGETVEWHRVAYDYEQTIAKIARIPELDPALGARLKEGM